MATDFKYASQSDLNRYCGDIVADADSKRQIYNWASGRADFWDSSLDLYYSNDSGYVDSLFWDGAQIKEITFNTTETTKLNGTLSESSTTITVDSSSAFGTSDIIKINGEYLQVSSAPDGTTLSVANADVNRGLFQTTASDHADDSSVYKIIDAGTDLGDTTSAGDVYGLSFFYDNNLDLTVIAGTSDPSDYVVEAGFNNTTYYDQSLVDASMELNNLLDARFPMPLPKWKQIDANTSTVAAMYEYDAIVIKMTCYIAASNALRAGGEIERADYYYDLVTNTERTGMADRLNTGEFKLAFEVDSKDSQGKIRYFSSGGTMEIIETAGQYVGEKYDLLKIICTNTGAYGVAKVKVQYFGDDKLLGSESDPEVVTGGLQTLSGLGGLYVRFGGSSMTENDVWEIEVNSADRKITNAQTGAIDLTRRGYSY